MLKARAHPLEPVVLIGDQGLTGAVIREIDRSLKAHELVKVRAFAERAERVAWFAEIARALNAEAVQHIGRILVFWRENPELAKARAKVLKPPPARKAPRLTKRQEENLASAKARPRSRRTRGV